jgi:hypothetical protein
MNRKRIGLNTYDIPDHPCQPPINNGEVILGHRDPVGRVHNTSC